MYGQPIKAHDHDENTTSDAVVTMLEGMFGQSGNLVLVTTLFVRLKVHQRITAILS